MRRLGFILLTMIISLSLLTSPVLAGSGKGDSGSNGNSASFGDKGSYGSKQSLESKNNSGTNNSIKMQEKSQLKVKDRTEKNVQTHLANISTEQRQKICNKINEKESQNVKLDFQDTNTHWASKDIQKAQRLGLIEGYENGTFKPEATISSTEAMVMAVRLAEILDPEEEITAPENENIETDNETTDPDEGTVDEEEISEVPEWAKDAVKKAAALEIININRFHSQVQATRAESAVMLAKALGMQPVDTTDMPFSDSILISAEDAGYILALIESGIIKGMPDGKFNPNSSITRAEIATMLSQIVDMVQDEENGDEFIDEGTEPTGTTGTTDQTGTDGDQESGTVGQKTGSTVIQA